MARRQTRRLHRRGADGVRIPPKQDRRPPPSEALGGADRSPVDQSCIVPFSAPAYGRPVVAAGPRLLSGEVLLPPEVGPGKGDGALRREDPRRCATAYVGGIESSLGPGSRWRGPASPTPARCRASSRNPGPRCVRITVSSARRYGGRSRPGSSRRSPGCSYPASACANCRESPALAIRRARPCRPAC